ncbi:metallophosphoesterase family protein [Roseibium sp. LAB1]
MTVGAGLPIILAGPILRRITAKSVSIWLAATRPCDVRLEFFPEAQADRNQTCETGNPDWPIVKAGESLYYHLIDLELDEALPIDVLISYRLSVKPDGASEEPWQDHTVWAPDICYPGRDLPCFKVPDRITSLFHGSCRKPHAQTPDGLAGADVVLRQALSPEGETADGSPVLPSLLVMSGDQVYADDVAGPMLQAIGTLVERLGLPDEPLDGVEAGLPTSGSELRKAGNLLYHRDTLLPRVYKNKTVFDVLFGGTEKPVFTTQHARNHLVTLGEMLAMYLLVWSPAPWQGLPELKAPDGMEAKDAAMYAEETVTLKDFRTDLPACRRVMAHLPTAMIFDDHDITDDWNLSLAWEQAAYSHPMSRRVIGNALIAYALNQAWGNRASTIGPDIIPPVEAALAAPGSEAHETAITTLLDYEEWDYQWQTSPPLIVLDTRTRRWRSERNAHHPSGLLDWEAATDFQTHLKGKDAVLLVSAAPIFGVKLIESVQKLFTLAGKPLTVDAEYWMAHSGTASAILNVFGHRGTPQHFVILSGDVHYSFVYDVELRQTAPSLAGTTDDGPKIWQICSSGIKNKWPDKLIKILDRGNRWAFSPRSPLNWFTKRRGMRVIPRKPVGTPHGRRILNASGIGLVELDETGAPIHIYQVLPDGSLVSFERREAEARDD